MVDTNVIVDGNLSKTEETGEEGGDVSNQNRNKDKFWVWYLIYNCSIQMSFYKII